MKRPTGQMSMTTFSRILEEIGDTMVCAALYGWGEPFLNPHLPAMISACHRRNIATMTSTNGNALSNLDQALELVDAGLSHLVIAIDGWDEESYQAYRKGGSLASVLRCAELIEEAKRLRKNSTPYTNIRTVVMSTNVNGLPHIEERARSIGVNMFSWKSVGCLVDHPEYGARLVPEQGRSEDRPAAGALSVRCPYPWRQPTIFWDGSVVACEFDYDGDLSLGNINQLSFSQMWNGPRIRELRRMFRSNKKRPDYCTRCPYPSREAQGTILGFKELRPLS